MSAPRPQWASQYESHVPTDDRHGTASSLPPGAMAANVPGVPPPVTQRMTLNAQADEAGQHAGAAESRAGGSGMGEFTGGRSNHGSHSSSTQPYPTNDHPSQGSTVPPSTYQTPAASASLGGRRRLPTPPSRPGLASSSVQRPSEAPLPPPRPSGRALPAIPPSVPTNTHGSSDTPRTSPNTNDAIPAAEPSVDRQTPVPVPPQRAAVPPMNRTPSDRVEASRRAQIYESPQSLIPYGSAPGYMDGRHDAGPSRSAHSHKISDTTSDHSYYNQSSTAGRGTGACSTETGPTSMTSSSQDHGSWHPPGDSLDEVEGTGTNITLRPPSRGQNKTPHVDSLDGRRTPTTPRETSSQGHLTLGQHRQTISSSTTGPIDADLPATPTFAPAPDLRQQRSFLKDSSKVAGLVFPVPRLALPGSVSSAGTSRPNSTSGASFNSDVSGPSPSHVRNTSSETRQGGPHRYPSQTSSIHPSLASSDQRRSTGLSPSWTQQTQAPSNWVERKLQIHQSHADEYYDDEDSIHQAGAYDGEVDDYGDYEEDEEEEAEVNEFRFFQPAYLSEAALQLRDRVVRRRQTKAGIAWTNSFTGRDIVTTIQGFLPAYTREGTNDRRAALLMAQSLQNQLWFVEVDWDIKPLRDSSEDVFRFMGEMEGMGAGEGLGSELPSGLMTVATKCYSPSCTGDNRCYAPRCPFKSSPDTFLGNKEVVPTPTPASVTQGKWMDNVDPYVLRGLSEKQHTRQMVIRKAIQDEEQYEADLTAMEKLFIMELRHADPPVIQPTHRLETFINEVFCNEHELHEACRRLIDNFSIRERDSPQRPLIAFCGDIFLQAAAEFRNIYPEYTGNLPQAETALKKEQDENPEFRFFCERVVRENDRRRDIKYLMTRPSTQLQRYPAVLEAILNTTEPDDPDRDFLVEALASIQNLSAISQLKLFHASKGRGPAGKMQWFDLVPEEQRHSIEKKEQKRQMQIWELIQGEMEYVTDLETIDQLFVNGLRVAEKGIVIERPRLEIFLDDAFHNYRSLLEVHSRLLENLHLRQLEQHPRFGMISDLLFDAALNWQEAYMEYVTHYPIAKAKVQEEEHKNPKFAAFLKECLRDPASNRQDIYHFINRPIPRLLRYNLLLSDILKSLKETGAENHPDIETIPQVIEIISDLGKATQKGVAVNEAKVELWQYQHSLDAGRFGSRSVKDLDLLNPMRELIHRGKVYRQPEGTIGTSWTELVVLLFDHYLVLVKQEKQSRASRREEKQIRYVINRRPIPLELLSLGNFSDTPRARNNNKLFSVGGGSSHEPADGQNDATQDSKTVWPFTISFIGQGQLGGQYTLWTDSYAIRTEWQDKLQHAKVLRTEVNDANKVFELTPLSQDTFYMAPNYAAPKADGDSPFTGRVTCSVPFTTMDNRSLVAVGCDEGVWIGLRHDSRSLRKVLHVKAVTNIAVLEEFGIFLVLQDRSLLAYHLEALVPSASSPQYRAAPQRLSPGKDIVFFTVGQLSGRTLVLYMKKKGMDSLFRVLEPILGRNAEDAARQRRPFGNLLGQRTEWFRLYKDFFIPTEALNVHFLKHKLAVVCAKGFEIMDLTDLKGGSIPIFDPAKVRDRPSLAELQRRCDSSKPIGMFRSTETEFLLCYDSFGIYVDRHGEPNRDCQAIEWEGRPDSVAFHPPYLLLCSAPFVEVRHIDNAKLLQIYTGSDIRLTWDGTGGQARPFIDNPGPNGYGDETSSQEPRIHICQRPDRKSGFQQGIGQHVFELTPTLALNNPLLNPVHTHDSNYFPPEPLISHHRASSVMTSSTSDNYFANSMMMTFGSPGYVNAQQQHPPERSEVSWDSSTPGRGGYAGGAW